MVESSLPQPRCEICGLEKIQQFPGDPKREHYWYCLREGLMSHRLESSLPQLARWEGLSPPYATIVADPPWQYRKSSLEGIELRTTRRVADSHYSTMPIRDIVALPIKELAAPNAHLYLWVTNSRLYGDRNDDDGPTPADIMRAWGFRFTTTLTWVKLGAPGLGRYFRTNTEHVLFGVRGDCRVPPELRQSNVITAPRRGHSQKPPAFFDLVESVSPAPRVELFARQPQLGWDHWGHGYEVAS